MKSCWYFFGIKNYQWKVCPLQPVNLLFQNDRFQFFCKDASNIIRLLNKSTKFQKQHFGITV